VGLKFNALSHEIGAFPIETVSVVSLVATAVVGAVLLVYFKKHKPNTELDKKP
jgi:hypothetical protein